MAKQNCGCEPIIYSILFTLLAVQFFFSRLCFAQPISSEELIKRAKDYDGKKITYAGEVIGDIMLRGEYAWVNVNDGSNAIGIWLKKDLAQQIQYAGSYKFKGDRIAMEGVFYRSCFEHGGDLDIHAQSMNKLSSGIATEELINLGKRNQALAWSAILCLILILRQLKRG